MPYRYEIGILLSLLFLLGLSNPVASGDAVEGHSGVRQVDGESDGATTAPPLRPSLRDWSRPLLFETRLPFGPTGFRQDIPPIRYNRVEGVVLGVGVSGIEADDWQPIKPVGQIGYAFALKEVRFDAGLEARPFARNPTLTGMVVGARYRRNTATEDEWKAPWIENTLASLLFRNDFFDYYQVEGWSAYVRQPLGRRLQVSAGFVAEEHDQLDVNTTWSLFGGGAQRPGLAIEEGNVRALRLTADAGRVRELYEHPSGMSFRTEVEWAPEGLGGDLDYNRILADARFYRQLTRTTHVAIRVRGGLASDDAPVQKLFSMGGIGTIRGYPMNARRGHRMVLGNVEYGFAEFDFGIPGIQLFAFADGGYVDPGPRSVGVEDVLFSGGSGVSLAGRKLRIELAVPLRDVGFGHDPAVWFRLYPAF